MGTIDYSTKEWGKVDETPEQDNNLDKDIVVDVPENWFDESQQTSEIKQSPWTWLRNKFNF